MAGNAKSREPRTRTARPSNIEETIRVRAYELYERRGRVDGYDLDDWLQAEAEIAGPPKQPKIKTAKRPK